LVGFCVVGVGPRGVVEEGGHYVCFLEFCVNWMWVRDVCGALVQYTWVAVCWGLNWYVCLDLLCVDVCMLPT
jgi:hypothetical protein